MSQHIAGAGSRSLVYEGGGQARGWRRRAAMALVSVVVAFGVHAGAASAQTQIVAGDPAQQAFFQGWVSGSLMPTPDTPVTVTGTVCPGGQAMACSTFSPTQPTIAFPDVSYLFAAPYTADTVDQTRSRLEFLHELGHVFDWTRSSRSDPSHNGALRARFLRIMHISGSGASDRSWAAGRAGDMAVDPQEQFAMAYSYCAVYPTLPTAVMQNIFWGYGYTPDSRQYDQVCTLIAHARAAPAGAVMGMAARVRSRG